MRKPGRQDPLDGETEKNTQVMSAKDQRTEPPSRREGLLQAIAQEEARLARLEADQADSRRRLGTLQTEMDSLGADPEIRVRLPITVEANVPITAAEKVKMFRSLFRGREEVFPTRFVSKKTGKPGYAPACRNKFVKGVCELPKVKCGECPNQAFIPFDDVAVVGHLTGRHVMGVYPLLDDETCWFLAVDFDESTWRDDTSAFVETCRSVGVPAAVEKSRSGNGAHVWFFFSAPVQASIARKTGCYLITETMARRHQVSALPSPGERGRPHSGRSAMSEYQYDEFQAIDRPLTKKEMGKLRSCSTRARITPTSFVNDYSWGNFKGDEDAWMERYFDAFLYVAN